MSRSSGIGVWSDNFEASTKIHVNFWKFDSKTQEDCHFLDIGILLQDVNHLEKAEEESFCPSIQLYFPFSLRNQDIEDLYEKTIIQGSIYLIFNKSDLKLETYESKGYAKITNLMLADDNPDVYASSLNIDISKDPQIVTVTLSKSLQKGECAYARMRIYLNEDTKKLFSKKFRPQTSFLLPSFNEIEHVSFNINERRSLSTQISTYLANNKLKICTVDFFLVRESDAALLSQYSPFKRCRELEHNIWSSYLPTDAKDFDRKLAYHWQEKGHIIEHFGAFAKFSYSNDGFKVLLTYLVIALLLGLMAGSGGNLISDLNVTKNDLLEQPLTLVSKNPFGLATIIFISGVLLIKFFQKLKIIRRIKLIYREIKSHV